jgi:hypothetical protein
MEWTAMVSVRANEHEIFGMEREATVEVSNAVREIRITYLPQGVSNRLIIKSYEIDSTASPCAVTHYYVKTGDPRRG